MSEKSDFFGRSCLNQTLNSFTFKQFEIEYNQFGLIMLLNGIVGKAVPTESEEQQLKINGVDINTYIYKNFASIMGKINFEVLSDQDNKMMTTLKDAMWKIVNSCNSLNKFRDTFVKYLCELCSNTNREKIRISVIAFVCFSRSSFELQNYQAPYRTSPELAIKDALNKDNLWKEYLKLWVVPNKENCCVDDFLSKILK